ncbi:hypothetical protein LELG_05570 [Lodderomyces elongisporus NRRL YB-4239]|uniref:F-box domain-containing protein n=1 Tax=Lodderomyces elongisporus (strain ATCC 11503 / CBS 2605 / JCM 1781 / NBRC 1676 / NRRL YB-4239) TaxID=379508 RepID=A5E7I1_LODEL|nr:hypothetical protein LELG_05570 [Lodderomyces elongisporus NRRL YB-4239]
MPVQSLLTFPEQVRDRIISYLPQQALINLATTNYEFYHPCMKKLYSKIAVSEIPPLRCEVDPANKLDLRRMDFQDSTRLVIYGLQGCYKRVLNIKMINARLEVLVQALTINTELISYIKEIHILLKEPHLNQVIHKLSALLKLHSAQLNYFYTQNQGRCLFLTCPETELRMGNLTSLVQLENLSTKLGNVTTLIFPSDQTLYWQYMSALPQNLDNFSSLSKFKFVINTSVFDRNVKLVNLIPWNKLKSLELVFDYPTNSNVEDYLIDFLALLPESVPKLKSLSIIQGTIFPTHASNEIFDLNMFNLIRQWCANLDYLSIKHKLPIMGNFPDGMEGNYRRRYELYLRVLPKLINQYSSKPNVILNLPNLFQTFACYEQYMNTVLYNGCKCHHCEHYLQKLDWFLMHHKYYNVQTGQYRDMNASHLFSVLGRALNDRLIQNDLITQLDQLAFPIWNCSWDFHEMIVDQNSNCSQNNDAYLVPPLKCLEKEIIEYGEYDEDNEDGIIESTASNNRCEFSRKLFSHLPKCISHYLNDLVQEILNLHRGNAEQRADEVEHGTGTDTEVSFMDSLKDGGDLDTTHPFNIRRIIINGIVYNIGAELNGTHYYVNVYDG